jgi:hypothetical protein
MVTRKQRPVTTQDQMLKRIPGWKQPVAKAEAGADGEAVAAPVVAGRESVLPVISDMTEMITKDGIDQKR